MEKAKDTKAAVKVKRNMKTGVKVKKVASQPDSQRRRVRRRNAIFAVKHSMRIGYVRTGLTKHVFFVIA